MFESIISEAINSVLGRFVEGVDPQQLAGTRLLSGSVTLKDLTIKSTLFEGSPVPFRLRWGKVGRIFLKIPIWDMFKSPLVVELEDVVALVGMKPVASWNEELQRKAFRARQQYLLDQFELYLRQTELLEQTDKQDADAPASFSQRIVDRIINNVKITVKRTYIRFEDFLLFDPSVSFGSYTAATEAADVIEEGEEDQDKEDDESAGLLEQPGAARNPEASQRAESPKRGLPRALDPSKNKFAIGIKLKEFSVVTCDEEYGEIADTSKLQKEQEGGGTGGLTFKKARVDGLSVFVDWMDNGDDYIKSESERQENQKQWDMYQPAASTEGGQRREAGASLAELREQQVDLGEKFEEILDGEFSPENQREEASPLFKHKYIINSLQLEVLLQLNKDVKNPVLPASAAHPQIQLRVRLGQSEDAARGDGALAISVFQPQLFRIMKTVEVIGFFNEFKAGALAEILAKKLDFGDRQTLENIVETNTCLQEQDESSLSDEDEQSSDPDEDVDLEAGRAPAPSKKKLLAKRGELKVQMSEVDRYVDLYMRWRGLAQSKKKKEQADAKLLREQMRLIEDTVDHKQIISVRQAAIQKIKSDENRKREEEALEAVIQKEVRAQVGFGLFLSAAAQRKLEAAIRAKYQPEAKKIAQRYSRTEARLSASVQKLLADMGQEGQDEEEKEGQEQELARGKTQMLAEEGIADLKAVDMKQILNRAFKYLPPDFIVIDLRVEAPALSFSIVNEFAQNVLLVRVEQIDFQLRKAARAFFNFRIEILDFYVRDDWSTCTEAGIDGAKFQYLARVTDEDDEEEDPFGEQSTFTEKKAAAIFFERRDSGPPHLEAKFKRKLTLYILQPVVIETKRTLGQAFGAGRKMDFRFYEKLARARVRELQEQARDVADDVLSNGSRRKTRTASTKQGHDTAAKHSALSLDVDINAPVLVLPESPFLADSPVLEVHLGRASAKSRLLTFDPAKNYAKILEEPEVYDSYNLKFQGFKALVRDMAHSEEEHVDKPGTNTSRHSDHQHAHMIIEEISFEVDIHRCLAKHHPLFPTQRVCVHFRKPIEAILDDLSLQKMTRIVNEARLQSRCQDYKDAESRLKKRVTEAGLRARQRELMLQAVVHKMHSKYLEQVGDVRQRSERLLRESQRTSSAQALLRKHILDTARSARDQPSYPRLATKKSERLRPLLSAEKSVRFAKEDLSQAGKLETSSFGTDSDLQDSETLRESKGRAQASQGDGLSELGSHHSKLKRKQTLSQAFSFDENGGASTERSTSTELNFSINKFAIKVMSETCEQKEAGENVPIILLEIKDTDAQVMIENNGRDVALDLGVHTVQIRESTEQSEQRAKAEAISNGGELPTPEDPRALFQKVLSNPREDLESRWKPEQTEHLEHGHRQLKLQLFIRTSESFDPATQLKVTKSTKSLSILIDETRLIYNVPTVMRMLKVVWPLRTYIFQRMRLWHSQDLERKVDLLEDLYSIARKGEEDDGAEEARDDQESDEKVEEASGDEGSEGSLRHRAAFIEKVYSNMAIEHGALAGRTCKDQGAFWDLLMFVGQHTAQHLHAYREQLTYSRPVLEEGAVSRAKAALRRVQKILERKMDEGALPYHELLQQAGNYSFEKKQREATQLYVIKILPFESKFNVKIKLKNVELWSCDYNRYKAQGHEDAAPASPSQSSVQPGSSATGKKKSQELDGTLVGQRTAQILQTSFMMDFFYDAESFRRQTTSSSKRPPPEFYERQQEALSLAQAQLVSQNSQALFNKFNSQGTFTKEDSSIRGTSSIHMQTIRRKLAQRFPSLRKSEPASTKAQPSTSQSHFNPYTEADFDAAVNLVTEWKCLSFKSNMQFNIRRLQAQQLMVNKWSRVQRVVDQILLRKLAALSGHRRATTMRKARTHGGGVEARSDGALVTESLGPEELEGEEDDFEHFDSDVGEAESGPPRNAKDFSNSVSGSQINSTEDPVEDAQFQLTQILQPTCVELHTTSEGQDKKLLFSRASWKMDPLALKLDFKDIELMMYLRSKTAQDWKKAFPTTSRDAEAKAANSEKTDVKKGHHEKQKINKRMSTVEKMKISRETRRLSLRHEVKAEDDDELHFFSGKADRKATAQPGTSTNTYTTIMKHQHVHMKSLVLCVTDGDRKHFSSATVTQLPVPLVELCISELNWSSELCQMIEKQPDRNPYMMLSMHDLIDLYANLQAFVPPFNKVELQLSLYATYYNQLSQAFEPFLEPWSLNLEVSQQSETDRRDIKVFSSDLLNLNITYGMALNILKVKSKLQEKLKNIRQVLEAEAKAAAEDYSEKPQPAASRATPARDASERRDREESSELQDDIVLDDAGVRPSELPITRLVKHGLTRIALHDGSSETSGSQGIRKNQKMAKTGYKFFNYAGAHLKLCISDDELDENLLLRFQRQRNVGTMRMQQKTRSTLKVVAIPGEAHNQAGLVEAAFVDSEALEKQVLEVKRKKQADSSLGTQDFIEEEPFTIDLKVEGLKKVRGIPIEQVGVHSYVALGLCRMKRRDLSFDEEDHEAVRLREDGAYMNADVEVHRPVNLIVNVKTQGRKRLIFFESQLLLTNNLEHAITLVFQLNRVNEHNQDDFDKKERGAWQPPADTASKEDEAAGEAEPVRIGGPNQVKEVLAPNDIFRVPLTWMMQDSHVDLYIAEVRPGAKDEDLELLLLHRDLQGIFNQTAADPKCHASLKSQQVELNDDFYVSVDIQGYKCLPETTKHQNPLQYVLSFNPPLLLQNLSFSPLEVIEIDNPCTPDFKLKTQGKIAPTMSQNFLSLDMSQDNKSWIRFVFTDKAQNLMISCTIKKFFKGTYGLAASDRQRKDQEAQPSDESQLSEEEIKNRLRFTTKSVKFVRHETQREYDIGKRQDGGPLETMQVQMEPVRKVYTDIKLYRENFQFRERHFDRSNAVKIMMYPRFVVVNKSDSDIIIVDAKRPQVIKARSNDYLFKYLVEQKKEEQGRKTCEINLEVEGFEQSAVLDLLQAGTSGIVTMNGKGDQQHRQLQFGVSISRAPLPFQKTTIITVVPRYVIVNKLKHPIVVHQAFEKMDAEKGGLPAPPEQNFMVIEGDCDEDAQGDGAKAKDKKSERCHEHQRTFHMMRTRTKGDEDWEIVNKLRFKYLEPDEMENDFESEIKAEHEEDSKYWCLSFSVLDIEDFQTQLKIKGVPEHEIQEEGAPQKLQEGIEWFEPQAYNRFHLLTRVIVTMSPGDNNSTIMIIFDEPHIEEFLIKNKTESTLLCQKINTKTKAPFEEAAIEIQPRHRAPFVWQHRENLVKKIEVSLGEDLSRIISIDGCTETGEAIELFRDGGVTYFAAVRPNTKGTKIISLTQESRAAAADAHGRADSERESDRSGTASHVVKKNEKTLNLELGFKGFGLTLIDNKPQELIYVCINEFDLKYHTKQFEIEDSKGMIEHSAVFLLDIGNVQIDNLVNEDLPVLFGQKNYYDRNIIVASKGAPPGASAAKIEKGTLSHAYRLVLDEDLMPQQYDKNGNELERLPFVRFNFVMSKKRRPNKVGSIINYKTIYFGMQEVFLQAETTIVNDNIKFLVEILALLGQTADHEVMATEESYEQALAVPREQTCAALDASQGIVFDERLAKYDKISFGIIMICSVKADITFRLQRKAFSFDLSNPRSASNSFSNINPFLSSFAQIQDANVHLNELVILEGYFSQQRLIQSLTSHFIEQGKSQVLKIVGSSNMLGNPVGLFSKIGVGFVELRREPAEGMRQGPGGFIKGMGKGLAGMVKGVVGGTFDSVGSLTGSLYAVIKDSAWMEDTREDEADNIGMGLAYGVKGIGVELYYGVGGVFSKPYHGGRRGGFKGFSKGLGQGLVGLVATPVTATLRAGESISQGISGSATALANLGKAKMELMSPKKVRVRPPRRIDVRNQIKIYDEDMAVVNDLIRKINKGFFADQQIRFYAVLPNIDAQGGLVPMQKSLLLMTNEYLIFIRVFNFVDLLSDENLSRSLLLSERLRNILFYRVTKFEEAGLDGDQYMLYLRFRKPLTARKMTRKQRRLVYQGGRESESEQMEEGSVPSMEREDDASCSSCVSQDSYYFSSSSAGSPDRSLKNRLSRNSRHSSTINDQQMNKRKESFEDSEDGKTKYEFAIYSPSFEILKRVHALFTQVPDIVQNMEREMDTDRLRHRHKHKHD